MNGSRILLDTNIVLFLLSGDQKLAQEIDAKHYYLSFITELELLGYSALSARDIKRVKDFLRNCTIIDINAQIKDITIETKRKYRIRLPDCIIAATSKFLDVPLFTADRDFTKLDDMDVIFYEVAGNH